MICIQAIKGEKKVEFKLTEKQAKEYLEATRDKDPQSLEMLGEDWIDGYKTGLIDALIMLNIPVSTLKDLANLDE